MSPRRAPSRLLFLAPAVAAALALGGCIQLFEPAKAQAPTGSSGNVTVNYANPTATLETIALGMGAKGLGNGAAAYSGGFADPVTDGLGFTTDFDPEVARAYEISSGHEPPTWNLNLEKDFYTWFVGQRTNAYLMQWKDYEEHGNDIIGATEATLHRRYLVLIANSDGIFSDTLAVGIADLELRLFGTRWAVTLWTDLQDPELRVDPTVPDQRNMSYLRLEDR